MISKDRKLALLYELKRTINTRQDRRPHWFTRGFGLCTNFENMSRIFPGARGSVNFRKTFLKHVKSWPHYSGDRDYFIPSPSPAFSASSAYDWQPNQYDRRSPYCKLRYELLDHIIRCVEAE